VWSYGLLFGRCANGQQLKCLTVTDELIKEGLAIEVDARRRSAGVVEVLSRLVSERGAPVFLRSSNGPAFVDGRRRSQLNPIRASTEYFPAPVTYSRANPPTMLTFL
jgi:hypothetical protein